MDKIAEDLAKLTTAVTKLNDNITKIDDRVAQCEYFCKTVSDKEKNTSSNDDRKDGHEAPNTVQLDGSGYLPPSSELNFSTVDVQREFKSIKEAYARKTLPPELVLNAERSGIKSEDKPKLNVLIGVSRYSETALKVLASSNGEQLNKPQLDELATCITSLQNYIQEEYWNLVVRNTFNPETSTWFKQLQRNSSSFPETAINNLQKAATLATAAQQQSQNSSRGNRGGSRPYRGGYRGRGYRGRGYSDVYQGLANSNIPQTDPFRNNEHHE